MASHRCCHAMQVSGFLGGLLAGVLLVRLWALLTTLGSETPCLDIFHGAVGYRSVCEGHADMPGLRCWAPTARQLSAAASAAAATAGPPRPIVYPVAQLYQDDYGRSGLSHITVAGARHHGMQRLEVWLHTFAPGVRTPVHRCARRQKSCCAAAMLSTTPCSSPAHRLAMNLSHNRRNLPKMHAPAGMIVRRCL